MSAMRRGRAGAGQRAWDEEYDVVVVGFGGAGACAAIQAADDGARVLVLERYDGGGSTKMSAGAIYAGGGSDTQRAAGIDDDKEQMLRYLERETGGAVDKAVLRAFCEQSLDNLRWLESHGVTFPAKFFPKKTTQPPDEYGLYFSGNEKQRAEHAAPAPRGHVPAGRGMTGGVLYNALKKAAIRRGVTVLYRNRPERLITDGRDRVVGVETRELPSGPVVRGLHRTLFGLGMVSRSVVPVIGRLENATGRTRRVRAAGGVVICSGGFMFNRQMVDRHSPQYAGCMPLGTPGDDGGGIRLGQSVGGAVASMQECAAWRFIYPPEAFMSGVLVNEKGARICDESLYGATFCRHIAQQPGGRAFLVVDSRVLRDAREQLEQEERLMDHSLRELFSGEMNALIFRKLTAFLNMNVNRRKTATLEKLEAACNMPPGSLIGTVAEYNACIERGQKDAFGKAREYTEPLVEPPFYAINCDLDNVLFLGPCITLGGLRVKGESAQVLREDGSPIPGLYAAGRSAVGVCSGGYVSGLSLADCVFSGRNAGRSAAAEATGKTAKQGGEGRETDEKLVKLVYILHAPKGRSDEATREVLLGEVAQRLVERGARRLGMDIRDAESRVKSPAPRMIFEQPISALVNLWIEDVEEREPFEKVLRSAGFTYDGYLVDESVYTDYGDNRHARRRDWPDGRRSPGIMAVTLMKRPRRLTKDEWIRRWHGTMSPVSEEIQPRARYVRNLVIRSLTQGAPPYEGIVEEAWPSKRHITSPWLFYGADNAARLAVNMARILRAVTSFLDLLQIHTAMMGEYFIKT